MCIDLRLVTWAVVAYLAVGLVLTVPYFVIASARIHPRPPSPWPERRRWWLWVTVPALWPLAWWELA